MNEKLAKPQVFIILGLSFKKVLRNHHQLSFH